MREIELIIDS